MVRKLTVLLIVVMVLASLVGPAAAQEPVFRVTLVTAETPGDLGWNYAHWRGFDDYVKTMGAVIATNGNSSYTIRISDTVSSQLSGRLLQINYQTNGGYDSGIVSRMRSGIEIQKPSLVFASWYDSKDAAATLAEEYPQVLFEQCSGYPDISSSQASHHNLSTYMLAFEQANWLVGYYDGLEGLTKWGLVGTYQIPEPVRGINAFALGLRAGAIAANNLSPIQVHTVWMQSWGAGENTCKESSAAQALLDSGQLNVGTWADTPTACNLVCAAKLNNPALQTMGYDSDPFPTAPCVIVSPVWRWGVYYRARIIAAMTGTWTPGDAYWGFKENAIGLAWHNANAVNQAKTMARLKSGFDPFRGPYDLTIQQKDGKLVVHHVSPQQTISYLGLLTMAGLVEGVDPPYPSTTTLGLDPQIVDQ